jgi:D-arginine utilization repressor
MKNELNNYTSICEAISKLFYPNVEVVMHDLISKKIVYISNSFSKRRIGDRMINDLEDLASIEEDFVGPYEKIGEDGRKLKAVSIVLRDAKRLPIGMICVNYDIETLETLIKSLKTLTNIEKGTTPATLFSQNWKEHTNQTIDIFLKDQNISLVGLTNQDKKELVKFLQKEGIFEIRNALVYVCKTINVSRATIYNWLKQFHS